MKNVRATYQTQGLTRQIVGTSADVYIQLDVLCAVLGDFHLVSVVEVDDVSLNKD